MAQDAFPRSTLIESFEIVDYRSCVKTSISLQPDLSVLIGPNGSGKTNILTALILLRSLAARQGMHRSLEEKDLGDECRLKAAIRHNGKSAILNAQLQVDTDENNTDSIVASRESWYAKDFTRSGKHVQLPLWLVMHEFFHRAEFNAIARHFAASGDLPEGFRQALSAIATFLLQIKYYSASQFTNPSLCPVSLEVEQEGPRSTGVRLRGHSKFLFDLYRARNTEGYLEFTDVIGPRGIGLIDELKFQEVATSSVEYTVHSGGKVEQRKREKILVVPQFVIGRNDLSPSQLSEGTFKTITLLFYLMTQESSILLIEEPEVCVHHGLLSSIVELIKQYSKRKQIILSTHSDFVLDQVEPRHVYKVSRSVELGTEVKQVEKSMSLTQLKALKTYLDTEGNLGEYWRHGGFD